MAESSYSGGSLEADHLCVLVHGLWGNPNHMVSVAKALRAQHPADRVYILVAKRNSGSFTYDGIELGGERVCAEIEEELELIKSKGGSIKKLSIVGYSLGGLVARYAIGLLFARGVLDGLECMNFTAFASPFVGVRTPLRGWMRQAYNVLGARTLCASGRQLFGIDKFRDTGRPLLAVLADPGSIFMSGLARFRRRTLYANIINDRTAVYYTTAIDKTDPYADLANVRIRFLDGWEDVILDPTHPVSPKDTSAIAAVSATMRQWARRAPLTLALALFVPLGVVAFLVNSAVQTVRSARRVRLHYHEHGGPGGAFRGVGLFVKEVRGAVENAYGALGPAATAGQGEYLVNDKEDVVERDDDEEDKWVALERKRSRQDAQPFPTLALAGYQFAAIEALDQLGWRKYPVWIHKHRHSHAAIIVRMEKSGFEEGRVVLRHWATEEFLL
ncbi:putative serine esterase-domain-containing protein [Corynascus similis CBS 632.67]